MILVSFLVISECVEKLVFSKKINKNLGKKRKDWAGGLVV